MVTTYLFDEYEIDEIFLIYKELIKRDMNCVYLPDRIVLNENKNNLDDILYIEGVL